MWRDYARVSIAILCEGVGILREGFGGKVACFRRGSGKDVGTSMLTAEGGMAAVSEACAARRADRMSRDMAVLVRGVVWWSWFVAGRVHIQFVKEATVYVKVWQPNSIRYSRGSEAYLTRFDCTVCKHGGVVGFSVAGHSFD